MEEEEGTKEKEERNKEGMKGERKNGIRRGKEERTEE